MRSVGFLFKAPLILAVLFVINLMTSPGDWWVQWAALGLGIAWVFALFRVLRAVIVAGGLAALGIYLFNRQSHASRPAPASAGGTRPPDIPTVPLRRE
ncbi:MAG: hypothetical protein ACM3H9_08115 [Rhodospirillaceae bacterium]|jgi:hypothetical protein